MYSTLIGKIDKAHRYAEERDRFAFDTLAVTIHGDNSDHHVRLDGSGWRCDCDLFAQQMTLQPGHEAECAHTMALQVMLGEMLRGPVAIA